jgi:glycosyltransferase involved in cell wall biosynthesis
MNKVYNVMDVFFLSTSGEGFGVPIIEAMAAEIPVVVTDYTTTPELVLDDGQCGLAVPIYNELTGSWNVERGLINIEKAAQALTNLYDNKKTRERFGKTGRKKVLKQYTWKEVIRQWESFLESI